MVDIKKEKQIKIGYQNYQLDFWPESFASSVEAEGEFFPKEHKIGVRANDLNTTHGANTVLHEVLHGVVYQYGLHDVVKDGEERIVNTLSNGLMSVFVDNPWFLDYLKQAITQKQIMTIEEYGDKDKKVIVTEDDGEIW